MLRSAGDPEMTDRRCSLLTFGSMGCLLLRRRVDLAEVSDLVRRRERHVRVLDGHANVLMDAVPAVAQALDPAIHQMDLADLLPNLVVRGIDLLLELGDLDVAEHGAVIEALLEVGDPRAERE